MRGRFENLFKLLVSAGFLEYELTLLQLYITVIQLRLSCVLSCTRVYNHLQLLILYNIPRR